MAGLVEGKVALITGAGSGIGRATALEFARQGARVVAADIVSETAAETAQLIQAEGGEAASVLVDVTDEAAVAAMVDFTVAEYGRLDCAHNNAGILGPLSDIANYPREEFDRVLAVNVTGVWLCLQAEVRQMLKQDAPDGGHTIVNTSSVAGLVSNQAIPAYTVSKHAVIGLTTSAAQSYGRQGIRVNAVCPALIETAMSMPFQVDPDKPSTTRVRQAIDRNGQPEEVAALVVWLSSAASSFVTGTPVRVDGGALA
ncbi:MAG: glucose 1-dehydrogenase [Dehalococcoidia bacterium]|jgi:NAD(P)-dependent dehydrogenase (short-subunit alcohol dehydrogenase family)|nr:glucose 1-dehydrogenase [Dehalococcoidia bacterium]